jgi:hypothetical protein
MIQALLDIPACASEMMDVLLLPKLRVHLSCAYDHEAHCLLPQGMRPTVTDA